ncbi:hypothetical protein [Sphingopyxis sp.]|uniref:hypothetical protein n=1 Tax=Sphingopyxis sp. TaxID=1908224 RepID=UPI003D12F5C8
MRASLIAAAFAAFAVATPVAAEPPLVPIEAETVSEPSALVPLSADSPWTARFAAAADELLPALRSLDESQWAPLLGGQWLASSDRARVAALLADRDSPFRHALFARGFTHRVILGWQPPASLTADDRAAIAARPEAEAIVCWGSGGPEQAWPQTAAEADNAPGRPYACARITYSIRGETPNWRAFIERG